MTDVELFSYHMREAEKAFNRLEKKYQVMQDKAEDRWLTTKSACAEYLDISRTTFYKNYIDKGLEWKQKGVKKSTLDNFQPEY